MSKQNTPSPWVLAVESQMLSVIEMCRLNNYPKAHITSIVGLNGELFEGINVPVDYCQTQLLTEGVELMYFTINASNSACKSVLIEEEGQIAFDVMVGGIPQICRINPALITSVSIDGKSTLPIVGVWQYALAAEMNKAGYNTEVEAVDGDGNVVEEPEKPDSETIQQIGGRQVKFDVVSDENVDDFDQDLPRPTTPFTPKIVH